MVNDCGHSLCSSCVNLLFVHGQAPCPQCLKNLKKNGFEEQMFDDPMVDKEIRVRRNILKVFNKQNCDFSSEAEYDDYLEKIEDLVWACMDNEPWAEQEIHEYKKNNQLLIKKNKAILEKQGEERDEMIRIEEQSIEDSRKKLALEDKKIEENRRNKVKQIQQKLINGEDTLSILDATESLNKIESDVPIETKVIIQAQDIAEHVENYFYQDVSLPSHGPAVPSNLSNYFGAIRSPGSRQLAAGFTIELGLQRALTDAFSCLAWRPTLEAEMVLSGTEKMEY